LIEHLRVRDRADVTGDAVVAQALEELGRAFARDLDLRERGLVEEGGGLAARDVLRADRGRPQTTGPAARPQRLVTARRVRLEPVRAFPPGLLPECGTELDEARIGRRHTQRSSCRTLVPWILDVVVRRVDRDRPRERVVAAAVVAAEAARVHLPRVEARDALDDPLGDELAHSARACETVRAEAGGDPEAAHGARPEDELAVRRERLGS